MQSPRRENVAVRKEETKLSAPVHGFSPQEMGGQVNVRGRRMEGRRAQSLKVCVWGRGRN